MQGNGIGELIFVNKDYIFGFNVGIVIGLWGGCEVCFNLGSGGKCDDIQGMKFSVNQWVYFVLLVDVQVKCFSVYILDLVFGVQKVEDKVIVNIDVIKLGGLVIKVWGMNDDVMYNYVFNNLGLFKGVMVYDDFVMWMCCLMLDEFKMINGLYQLLLMLNF